MLLHSYGHKVIVNKFLISSLLANLFLAACTGLITESNSTVTPFDLEESEKSVITFPVVIDTDMAPDDWMAILYLLRRPDVSVRAVTVTGAGETHCEPGVENALGLLALAGQPDIPVACGRETPLMGDHVFPDTWRQAVDGMLGLELPLNDHTGSALPAAELLAQVIASSPDKVHLLTLGPLTNVAEALQTDPSLVENIETITIMGGAVDVAGNIAAEGHPIDNHTAEWNIYLDPHAARIVIESGAPITLVPLDATNHAPLTLDFYRQLKRDRVTPEAKFVYDVLTNLYDMIRSRHYYFWDPLAAAILTDNSLAAWQTRKIIVIDEEGPESGRTKPVENGFPVQVAVSADRSRFEDLFLSTLNSR